MTTQPPAYLAPDFDWDPADVAALKALEEGRASPDQQKRALIYIVNRACRTFDDPFVPGQPDLSANLGGRRSAGLRIVKLCNMDMEDAKKPRRPRASKPSAGA